MPELPDLAIVADALATALPGRVLLNAETPQTLVLRGTPAELGGFAEQTLTRVSRRGKFLVFEFTRDKITFNPMLTGRLGLAASGAKKWPNYAAVFRFSPVQDHDRPVAARRAQLPAWPGAAAAWLPERGAEVELRYRDATRMGKIYLLPVGVDRPVAGWDELGPDADDPDLTLDIWRDRIAHHSGELKNLLRNQVFVAGIGNAYSDEILWAARLAPFRKRGTLASAEIDVLYGATREVLSWAIGQLRILVPPRLEVEQRNFLNVHRKGGQPCPRCGTKLSEVSAGGFVTTFCRACQS